MRTTLSLDDDVLAAARVLARQRKQPISVISALAREALGSAQKANSHRIAAERNGLTLLTIRPQGAAVDLKLVNSLRDD